MTLEFIAHRGASSLAPENTLAAFRLAISNGVTGIEFDLQLSADDVPVVIHDAGLERTTDGSGRVRDRDLAYLKQLDAGSWFDPKFVGQEIPTLQQVLELAKDTTIDLYPELKYAQFWSENALQNLVKILSSPPWQKRTKILAFDPDLLERIRRYSQSLILGLNIANGDEFKKISRYSRKNMILSAHYSLLLQHPQIVTDLSEQGIEIIAWTVDNREDMQQLADLGVQKIISNRIFSE